MTLGLDLELQTRVPGYTRRSRGSRRARRRKTRLDDLVGRRGEPCRRRASPGRLRACARVRRDRGLAELEPLTLEGLRGKVVLIDFWTYSCINCLRTLPYIKRWDETYRDKGLVVVGVHTPEFAFERVRSNVDEATSLARRRLSGRARQRVRDLERVGEPLLARQVLHRQARPRPLRAFRRGRVRGERERRSGRCSPSRGSRSPSPGGRGPRRPTASRRRRPISATSGSTASTAPRSRATARPTTRFRRCFRPNGLAYGGRWTVEKERIVAGTARRLRLRYHARKVHLVLGTNGDPEDGGGAAGRPPREDGHA